MNLTDGEWHRLHPATPVLRGGIAFIAIAGFVIANLRDRLLDLFFHVPDYGGDDPVSDIYERGLVGWALLAVLGVLLVIIGVFYLSWRMHSFRVTGDVVEVRSGLISRTHRRARLDRIQGVTINRSLLARLAGAAKIDISVAGQNGNLQLAYVGSKAADELRRDILLLASGSQGTAKPTGVETGGKPGEPNDALLAAPPAGRVQGFVDQRVGEFLAPELDPNLAAPESVVSIPPGRMLASVLLSPFSVFLIVAVGAMVYGFTQGELWPIFVLLPSLIGGGTYFARRFTRQLRFTVAGTPDGVRVGYGLLATNNETLPPGRIHAVGVTQPLLWRPFGWWSVQVDLAGRAGSDRQNRDSTTVLPVGTLADARAVLGLILPAFTTPDAAGIVEDGLVSRGGVDGFTNAPRNAIWLRPFSWRRVGFRLLDGVVLLRGGVVARQLEIVPLARMQSITVRQGPLRRRLGLASVSLQTVAGPVAATLDVAATATSLALFEQVAAGAVASGHADTSHRWRQS